MYLLIGAALAWALAYTLAAAPWLLAALVAAWGAFLAVFGRR